MNGAEIDRCLESDFSTWFKNYAQDASLVLNEYVRDLASGPLRSVRSVPIYYVNGYKFHTRTYGANKSTFNSGVCIKGSNYSETSNDYFGILDEILIIEYPRLPIKKTALFKCEWFDPIINVGTRVHQCYNIVKIKIRSPFFQAPQRSPEQTSQRSPDQAPHRSPDEAPQRSPDQALHQTQHRVAHTRVDTPEHTRAGTT
ncbi:DUF4216 domain-containing protein [Heracleum sosnowskyi]|uniref:DUF4216 domain-containing protein n=1 Tax=Heracleum sosnowskyi TaxID=360622 RepID=A0AAD8HP39_9APIA|nr:DUF4216 domain-containing protein [Heracleum sosnowskyi]